ncbi:DUF4281 domain-containing protein [Roseiconus nitratireducens]|uniref:DUF4281 domain-containing protein n=1 Tax=Roseiconus nitratireducens TaxID=2605748 RepID=A0A5M6DLX6_9BACT|nr:ABA4-like family protein [Roseiconus nitratireducens]KAA5547130.1 DUF4281 domain-containing protein [Roseiconus nitratireducens]
MSPEALFPWVNNATLIMWLLLLFLPGYRIVSRLLVPVVACGALATVYLVILVMTIGDVEGGFTSLDGVSQLFQNRWALLAGWIHYLAFDLFIGSWQVRDSQRNGLRHRWIVPTLLLTFLVGPIGLLVYLAIRSLVTNQLALGALETVSDEQAVG